MKLSTLLLSCALALTAAVSSQDPIVLGYVRDGLFHPFVLLRHQAFDTVALPTVPLAGRGGYLLGPSTTPFVLGTESSYQDPYTDEPGKYATVSDAPTTEVLFAAVVDSMPPHLAPDTALTRSFYRFFATDSWGQHFFDGVQLDGPLVEVAEGSHVLSHGSTDLDHDGAPELWLTYRLMWGEVGAMIWELAPSGWTRIANHCFVCD